MDSNTVRMLSSIHKSQHICTTLVNHKNTVLYTNHVHEEQQLLEYSIFQDLLKTCRESKSAKIVIDKYDLAFAGLYVTDTREVVILGPVFLGIKSEQILHAKLMRDFHELNIVEETLAYIKDLHSTSQSKFLSIAELANYYLNGEKLDASKEPLAMDIEINQESIQLESVEQDNIYVINDYGTKNAYESYLFEQTIMECIRTGDKEKLFSLSKFESDAQVGDLSGENAFLRQRKNECICACTLVTRAAIQGGMNIEKAYSLGNYYIRKIESLGLIEDINSSADKMFLDFAIRVSNIVDQKKYSYITDSCIQYISDHFCNSISVQKMAEEIGVSKNHLLTKFKSETKISVVDHIKNVKISEAKLLLKYGNMDIAEISEYLSFSSQSYFTSVFKQITGTTPKKYREKSNKNDNLIGAQTLYRI